MMIPCRNPLHSHRTMFERIDCARRQRRDEGDGGALVGARRKPPGKPFGGAAQAPEEDEAELAGAVEEGQRV